MFTEPVKNKIVSETLLECPWCASKRVSDFTEAFDLMLGISDQTFKYAKCNECQTVFQNVRPAENEIGKFYGDAYTPHIPRGNAISSKLINKINGRLSALYSAGRTNFIKKIYGKPKQSGRFLDFGCGAGNYLKKMKDLGWDCTGIDFAPDLIADLNSRGLKAFSIGSGEWKNLPDNSFELIRMNHVLEHVYNPEELLKTFYRLLQPGGRVHIALPNSQSLFLKFFKNNWFALDAPRHVMLISPESLETGMKEIGFKNFNFFYDLDPKDILRSLGYVFSKVLNYSRSSIVHWPVKYPAANLVFYPLAAVTAKFGKSDRYDMVAEK